jgi:hypothetical protein
LGLTTVLLEIARLSKGFGGLVALAGVDFVVAEGNVADTGTGMDFKSPRENLLTET